MLAFISFWRASAIVLCDLASSAYYIGGIVEQACGRSAPYFILAVMLFSYAVRAVYVESCSMFTRGGVYRVVKEAMGSTLAKISVSALMFDYILTGPISGVSAGQYMVGLINELLKLAHSTVVLPPDFTAAFFAIAVTVYFWRQNLRLKKKDQGAKGQAPERPQRPGIQTSATQQGEGPVTTRQLEQDSLAPYLPASLPVDPLLEARQFFDNGDYKGFYREVNRAIWKALSKKLDLPASQLNKLNITLQLQARGWDAQNILSLENTLNECEMNLYTPAYDTYNMQQLLRQAESMLDRLA